MSFFKEYEFHCKCGRTECDAPRAPHPELLTRLNIMRTLFGAPLVITSGNRCKFWNKKSGGKDNSEHLTGEGADLRCTNSVDRWKMDDAARQAGFERIGVGENFMHFGVSKDLAPRVMWTYYIKEKNDVPSIH